MSAVDGGDVRATTAFELIQRLYAVAREATNDGVQQEERLARRRERSAPLMDQLGAWIAAMHAAAPPRSPLGKALTYAINQWR